MTAPESAAQSLEPRTIQVNVERVIEQLGARIGALEAERAQLEDVIRQLLDNSAEQPRRAES